MASTGDKCGNFERLVFREASSGKRCEQVLRRNVVDHGEVDELRTAGEEQRTRSGRYRTAEPGRSRARTRDQIDRAER